MSLTKRELNRSELPLGAVHQHAISAAVWGTPIVSMAAMREAFFRDAQANYNDIVFWTKPADWRLQLTTPNASTHYVYCNFNTKNGPVVLEVPAAADAGLFGSILDAWQVPLADIGPEGADQGKGGKYLLLPPGYKESTPAGYIPVRFETFNGYFAIRAIPKSSSEEDVAKAIALGGKLALYPLSRAAGPPQQRFVDMSGKVFDAIVRFDETFYDSLARMVNEEPLLPRDLAMMSKLRTIGIEKDKEFKPDTSTRDVLKRAARETHAFFMDRARGDGAPYWPQSRWRVPSVTGAKTGFTFETAKGLDVDARGLVYFLACAPPAQLGKATFYLSTFVDSAGQLLAGENTYRLHVPANVPAGQFWALTVYDSETAAFIRNSPRVELNSYDQRMQMNADGSVDLYLGPGGPAVQESNWVYTEPGKHFFAIFRLYGPEKPLFDKLWELPNIDKTNITHHPGSTKP